MNITDILDIMDEMLDSSLAVPLSGGKCVVSADRFRELIQDLRENMPEELEQSKKIVAERKRILEEAQREAESKLKIAEERARHLVEEDQITQKIKERANDMMSLAHTQSRELKAAANNFAENILKTTEQGLMDSMAQVRNARTALRTPPATKE